VNADGRLEIAVVGTEVFHAWQCPGGEWSDWHSLKKPRELEPGSLLGGSTLASNEDGRLELFTKVLESDGTLWHRWQPEPGRGPWRDWHSLGRPPGTGGFASSEAPPALASNLDGRLELFVLVNDDTVWHRWQKVPNGGWSPWKSLEKPATGLQGEPAVVRNHDGRLELFSWDEKGTVWHRWQTKPGRGPWAAWASLVGVNVVRPAGRCTLTPPARRRVGARSLRPSLSLSAAIYGVARCRLPRLRAALINYSVGSKSPRLAQPGVGVQHQSATAPRADRVEQAADRSQLAFPPHHRGAADHSGQAHGHHCRPARRPDRESQLASPTQQPARRMV